MIEKVEGIILKESPYGDSSKIIQLFTKEYGLIGVMCKSAKKLNSKLRASTLLYTYGVFDIYYKEGKLSNLVSVDVINYFPIIRTDIIKVSYLAFLSDLVMQVIKQCDYKLVYNNFLASILKIEDGIDPMIISNILELKCLPLLGVGISLDGCAICGNKTSIVTIDGDAGGYLCKGCYTNERIVEAKTLKLLRMYYLIEINSISKVDISDRVKNEINIFIEKYYERYTGLYLKSKDFLKKLLDK